MKQSHGAALDLREGSTYLPLTQSFAAAAIPTDTVKDKEKPSKMATFHDESVNVDAVGGIKCEQQLLTFEDGKG